MNDINKEDNEEEDTFLNRLRGVSTKKQIEKFLKMDIYDQIHELKYRLRLNEDRIIELGFERERIMQRINSKLRPSEIIEKYGIGFSLKEFSQKNAKLREKRLEKLDKEFTESWKLEQERCAQKIKEIDIEIDKCGKKIQILKEKIQSRQELIDEEKEFSKKNLSKRLYQPKEPKHTLSILYDKVPPQFALKPVKKRTNKISRNKKKEISTFNLKICVFGEKGVGISTWLKDEVKLDYLTELERYMLGNVGFAVKSIKLENKTFKLQVWFINTDRIRKKRYYLFPPFTFGYFIRGCNGVFVVYDITNYKSLKHIPEWVRSIRETCGDIPVLLLGNKLDLANFREVSKDQAFALVQKHHLSNAYEISIKNRKNLDTVFQKICEFYYQKFLEDH